MNPAGFGMNQAGFGMNPAGFGMDTAGIYSGGYSRFDSETKKALEAEFNNKLLELHNLQQEIHSQRTSYIQARRDGKSESELDALNEEIQKKRAIADQLRKEISKLRVDAWY